MAFELCVSAKITPTSLSGRRRPSAEGGWSCPSGNHLTGIFTRHVKHFRISFAYLPRHRRLLSSTFSTARLPDEPWPARDRQALPSMGVQSMAESGPSVNNVG